MTVSCLVVQHDSASLKRIEQSHDRSEYNLLAYLAYNLYAPLFLAGPILCFNDFVSQNKEPVHIDMADTVWYISKLVFVFFAFEISCHYIYFNSVLKYYWEVAPSHQLLPAALWNLVTTYSKLWLVWRLARAVAMLDGIETDENMPTFVFRHYTFQAFWRYVDCE